MGSMRPLGLLSHQDFSSPPTGHLQHPLHRAMLPAQRWGRRRKANNDAWSLPRYSIKVLVLLCLALLIADAKREVGKIAACAGKKIFVMDIGVFAKEAGVPSCNLATDIKIDPMNGIPFLPDAWQVKHVEKGAPIAIAAHSGPWHLRQTIRGSTHHTTDMDEADIIYVYDHCYYMRWLAQVHSNGPKDQVSKSEGGEWLMKGYHALVKTERWKRNTGADFVFFDPHPGFTDGTSDKAFKKLMCQTSKDSMHIVVERGQVNICPAYFDIHDKLLIAPYVAGSSDTSKPLLGFKAPVKPIKERKTFLYLTASCLPYFYANANQTKVTGGKQFRHAVQLFLGNLSPDINLQCVDPTLGGHYTPFPQVLETMQDTVFCLMMPGDSASSRRTSEIFMAGCIPVFIGPPYATMPLGEAVNYKEAAYFFNITDHKFWFDSELLWENPKDVRPYHVQTPWYWFPDSDVADAMIEVKSLEAMLKYLRGIKVAELNKKLAALAVERFKFAYRHKLSATETATSVIMSHMCAKYDVTPAGAAGADKAAAAAEPEEEEEDEDER